MFQAKVAIVCQILEQLTGASILTVGTGNR